MFSINYFAKKVTQNRRKSQLFHFISFVISRLRVRSSQKHQSLSRVMTEKWRYLIHCRWKVSSQHSHWLRYKRPTSTIGLCKWVHMMNRRLSIKKIYMKLYLWEFNDHIQSAYWEWIWMIRLLPIQEIQILLCSPASLVSKFSCY